MTQPVTISFRKTPAAKTDTAVIFASPAAGASKAPVLLPVAVALDDSLSGHVTAALKTRKTFKGRHGDAVAVLLPEGAKYRQILVIGIGEPAKFDALTAENAGGKAFGLLKSVSAVNAAVLFDQSDAFPETPAALAASFASGLRLKDYNFDKYKGGKAKSIKPDEAASLETISVVLADSTRGAAAFAEYNAVANGVIFARDLVNEAPNALYPESYADILVKTLKPLGVEVDVLDEKKMQKLGFGAHLAVGQGSIRPPRVVVMRWNGAGGKKAKGGKGNGPIALVGKGVTFDTGGISIKPAAGMEEMKMDMGGSAAVAGAIHALAATKAKVDVVGIVGLAENMPSDRAFRPGDIVTSLSGKTIEVLNTDAEGRLVLCDALTYVQQTYKPSAIIDLATLTGAIMVALGYEYAGVFANDDGLWSQLEDASRKSGEKIWRMPLDEAYRDEMKNTVTDLKNLGNLGRYGGACSAAGFLEHFIENDTPWAHIDIAGTAWIKSDRATVPKGGTGYGVRLLYRLLIDSRNG